MDRRHFLKSSALGSLGIQFFSAQLRAETATGVAEAPVFVSTWNFGKSVNEAALATLQSGGSMLDAIEKGIWVAEADENNASVGIGGIPNADGVVQLDACIMAGPRHQAGSVAGVEDILHPISVARRVMEDTVHVMLVGDGAKQFAISRGFQSTPLLTEKQRRNFEARQSRLKKEDLTPQGFEEGRPTTKDSHDTIALIGMDKNRDVYGGCSTSGYGWKIPGRVGDSPIIGSGLYVDNEVGAAGATGMGENVMRYCASFMIVQEMRRGADPTTAIREVIQYIVKKDPLGIGELSINFIALDKQGRIGAAGTNRGFSFAVTSTRKSAVHSVEPMTS